MQTGKCTVDRSGAYELTFTFNIYTCVKHFASRGTFYHNDFHFAIPFLKQKTSIKQCGRMRRWMLRRVGRVSNRQLVANGCQQVHTYRIQSRRTIQNKLSDSIVLIANHCALSKLWEQRGMRIKVTTHSVLSLTSSGTPPQKTWAAVIEDLSKPIGHLR
jgi:hypothetical protein